MKRQLVKTVRGRVREHVKAGKGISNDIIRNICGDLCSDSFRGVYSSDRISLGIAALLDFIIIVNLEKRGSGIVGHFVTIIGSPESVLYLDPYGFPCANEDIENFMRGAKRPIYCCRKQIQSFNSVYCGVFAMLFALYFDKRPSFKLNFKSVKLEDNDKLCMKYLRRLVNENKRYI